MEHIPQLVADLALLLTVAAVVTIVCKKLKQPLVLGYVIAGFLISPAIGWLPNISDTENISTWSEIGVIFLMFGLGLEFSIVKLSTVGKPAIITALVEMALMIAAGVACGTLLGWSFYTSLFLGGMLAISSTTIIVKAFDELGLKGKKFTELVFGALVIEDIVGIFLMVFLSTIAVGSAVDGGEVALKISQMALYLIVWFVLSIIIVPTVLKKVAQALNDEILLIVSIALCLCMVVLANAIGFSAALGAFLAGSILAGTVRAHRIEELFKPIKDLFGAVFFVSVGMLVSPAMIVQNIGPIIAITLVTLIGKPIFSGLGALLSGQSLKTSTKTGLSLSQIGEFSFIIAALGVSLGVTADFLYPVIVAVSVITTLTTPFYIKNSERVYRLLVRVLPQTLLDRLERREEKAADEKDGNVWIDYLKRWGMKVALVVIAAVASGELLSNVAKPMLSGFVLEPALSIGLSAIGILITGIFMSNLFYSGRKGEFWILWVESKKNHAPLLALAVIGIIVSCGMVMYIVFLLGGARTPLFFVLAFALTFVLARSQRIHSGFLKLEASFIGNLNESILAERQAELDDEERASWVERQLYVVEVETTKTLMRGGTERSADYLFGLAYNLDLIAIERDGKMVGSKDLPTLTKEDLRRRISDPNDELGIRKGDLLTFLGAEDEVDAYLQKLLKEDLIDDEAEAASITLDDYLASGKAKIDASCLSFAIGPAASEFRGRTIASVDLRGTYGSLVIAIEHNALVKIKPSRNTRFSSGDRVWVLADNELSQPLVEKIDEIEADATLRETLSAALPLSRG
ncbi:cation:proton antiporter [Raoultibacter massiliensis]|uniref:cation:proton antiporter domain-containing protein n=1 Tax=Raoultibacter massiliensis TaxID=1852371 RepID=UPI000C8542C6|nr:cation:proton antiporter [Raoultibacter massiliensis]